MWFTNHESSDWTPERGYNEVFAEVIRHIRSFFQLKKTETVGIEVGMGYWRPYDVRAGRFYVMVTGFSWMGYRKINSITPVLRLDLQIGQEHGVALASYPLEITFPHDFPQAPAIFTVIDHMYQNLDMDEAHLHHVLTGGVLCIWGNDNPWNPMVDTVVSALNVAIDHLTWHLSEFGW